jgi:uncharacterized Zn finger protein (UPF0148 family)
LPQKGFITPLNEYCPECKAPTIQVKNGRFNYKMCLNMVCATKKDWVKKEDKAKLAAVKGEVKKNEGGMVSTEEAKKVLEKISPVGNAKVVLSAAVAEASLVSSLSKEKSVKKPKTVRVKRSSVKKSETVSVKGKVK